MRRKEEWGGGAYLAEEVADDDVGQGVGQAAELREEPTNVTSPFS